MEYNSSTPPSELSSSGNSALVSTRSYPHATTAKQQEL